MLQPAQPVYDNLQITPREKSNSFPSSFFFGFADGPCGTVAVSGDGRFQVAFPPREQWWSFAVSGDGPFYDLLQCRVVDDFTKSRFEIAFPPREQWRRRPASTPPRGLSPSSPTEGTLLPLLLRYAGYWSPPARTPEALLVCRNSPLSADSH